jgi:molybdopterin converting factor subunit 1
MRVCIRLFARARDLAGRASLHLDVAPKSTVGELRRQLAETLPGLAMILPRCAVAVHGEFAQDAVVLSPDAEVAILPPVSGG